MSNRIDLTQLNQAFLVAKLSANNLKSALEQIGKSVKAVKPKCSGPYFRKFE